MQRESCSDGLTQQYTKACGHAGPNRMDCENRLDDLLGSLPNGIACFDPSDRMIYCNAQFTKMFPATADLCAAGGTIFEIMGAAFEDAEAVETPRPSGSASAKNEPDPAYDDAVIYRLMDGRYCESRVRTTASGNRLVTCTDITRQRQAVDAASEAKNQFLSVMSHELITPLGIMRGLFELIEMTDAGGRVKHLASRGLSSSDQLADVIRSILDFADIEAGRIGAVRLPFVLGNLVDEVTGVAAKMGIAGGHVTVEIDQALRSSMLVGDAEHIRKVLLSLTSNALKFGNGRGIVIGVTRVGGTPQQPLLEFGVTDKGIGVTQEQQSRLFQPFTQLDMSTTRLYGGIGLGLAVCRRLVSLMGGESITVESQPGEGSRFAFRLLLPIASGRPAMGIFVIDGQRPVGGK